MTKAPKSKAERENKTSKKSLEPTGIHDIDILQDASACTLDQYIAAVSAYVRENSRLAAGPKKSAQIRLSNALALAFVRDFRAHIPKGKKSTTNIGEHKISGGLRTGNVDVSETHELDGVRVAIEIKPVNLAVGRAIWNRFGDLRTFAVNIHLKFPFSVLGGILVIPTWEEVGSKAAKKAETTEEAIESEDIEEAVGALVADDGTEEEGGLSGPVAPLRKSTEHLIERAIMRLIRAGGRKTEGDAAHLLEGIAVVVYNPDDGVLHPTMPPVGSGLRWDEFIIALATAYRGRFEE
jgi:hypothetical protein